MTPALIVTAARRKYNSSTSSFFADAEIWDLIYQAELEIATVTKCLEGRTVISGGSVAGTQSYAFPTGVLELKRVEYDGTKLQMIDFRQDDALTLADANATAQGQPIYYYVWDNTIYFRPIPDTSSEQIRLYYYKEPIIITSSSQALEVPALFHMSIVDRVVAELAAKDQNFQTASYYMDLWENKHMPRIRAWGRKRRTGDAFNTVKDESALAGTILGAL
jgi:hypothetical protein